MANKRIGKWQLITIRCDRCGKDFRAHGHKDGGDFCSMRCLLKSDTLFPPLPEKERRRQWKACREAILEGLEGCLIEERFGYKLYDEVKASMGITEREVGLRSRLFMRGHFQRKPDGQAA